MSSRPRLCESGDFILLLLQAPTKVMCDNQQVIVVDNIMMIDARNSETFLEDQRTWKILAWNILGVILWGQKGSGEMGKDRAFHVQKDFLVKSPILDQRTLFITWFMLLLKYWLCDIIFKLSFFNISFSSFTWTITNVNKLTHLKKSPILGFATEFLGKSSSFSRVLVSSFKNCKVVAKVFFTSEMLGEGPRWNWFQPGHPLLNPGKETKQPRWGISFQQISCNYADFKAT